MLKYFFEYGCDAGLFEGLTISKEKELCDKYMGKYPVIFVSLKEVAGGSYDDAKAILCQIIGKEASRFQFLLESERISETERLQYSKMIELNEKSVFAMADELLMDSLLTLSQLLRKHYKQKVIVLIDEYDVPLDKAFQSGYYDAMTNLIRTQLGMAELAIPNKEIRWIFVEQIQEWAKEESRKDVGRLEDFCRAFQTNDVAAIEEGFTAYLKKTISVRDTGVRKEMKENFYHGILLGLFGNMDDWIVMSNAKSGEGYMAAMRQIRDRHYEEILVRDGMKTIYRYGIACYKKRCRVVSG